MITPRQASRLAMKIVAEFDLDGVSVSLEPKGLDADPAGPLYLRVVLIVQDGPGGERVRHEPVFFAFRELELLQSEYRAERLIRDRLEVAAMTLGAWRPLPVPASAPAG